LGGFFSHFYENRDLAVTTDFRDVFREDPGQADGDCRPTDTTWKKLKIGAKVRAIR